jgi:hypothetical protein
LSALTWKRWTVADPNIATLPSAAKLDSFNFKNIPGVIHGVVDRDVATLPAVANWIV